MASVVFEAIHSMSSSVTVLNLFLGGCSCSALCCGLSGVFSVVSLGLSGGFSVVSWGHSAGFPWALENMENG